MENLDDAIYHERRVEPQAAATADPAASPRSAMEIAAEAARVATEPARQAEAERERVLAQRRQDAETTRVARDAERLRASGILGWFPGTDWQVVGHQRSGVAYRDQSRNVTSREGTVYESDGIRLLVDVDGVIRHTPYEAWTPGWQLHSDQVRVWCGPVVTSAADVGLAIAEREEELRRSIAESPRHWD